ncbi:MAG: YCF48-related protein, partial [Actinomycetota bacterium]
MRNSIRKSGNLIRAIRRGGLLPGFLSMSFLVLMGAFPVPKATAAGYSQVTAKDVVTAAPTLNDVAAADADHALVVGAGGSVYYTGDGGVTWIPRDVGTGEDLLAISVLPGAAEGAVCAWVTGKRGVVLRTADGGMGWERMDTGTGRDVVDVAAVDRDCAWAVAEGSLVLRTTDGGGTWEHHDTGNLNPLRCVIALDRNTALVAGENGTVLLTVDGGSTWYPQETGTADHLVDLVLVRGKDGGTVYALGDGGMLAQAEFTLSPGSGKEGMGEGTAARESGVLAGSEFAWSVSSTGVEAAPRALCAAGDGVMWVGGRGFLRRSLDGGEHWEALDMGIRGEINSLFAPSRDDLWAVGEEGLALRSYDGGRTWASQYIPRGRTLLDVWAVDPTTAWAVGEGGEALFTTDGGFTWSVMNPGTSKDLYAVSAPDAANAWVVGGGGTVLRSWNGGRSWEEQPSRTAYDLLDLHAVDGRTAWAVGRRGVILRTFDEGYTWYRLDQGEGPELAGVWAEDGSSAWAVGRGGMVLRITEEGQAVEWIETGAGVDLWAISGAVVDGKVILLAVGDEATVLRSADGGSSWEVVDGIREHCEDGSYPELLGVSIADAQHVWICGAGGFLARTSDGGNTWERLETGTGVTLRGVTAPEKDTAWAVGWRGAILHRRSSPRLDMISPAEAEAESTVTLVGLAFGDQASGSLVTFGDQRATDYEAWGDRLIRVAIPPGASVREEVRVITPRGSSTPRTLTIFPRLRFASPRHCRPGERVTLVGAAFGASRGDSFVSVEKARIQEYEYWSNNYIRFRMPGGLPPVVEIRVTTPSGASNPLKVRVLPESNPPSSSARVGPRMVGVDPPSGVPGSEVRILGSGFGSSRGDSYVTFGGVRATEYLSWEDGLVVVRVPSGAGGTVEVRVVVSGSQSNAVSFEVLSRPVIRHLNPSTAPPGSRVEIVGDWFGEREGPGNYASFGGVRPVNYEYWSRNRILVRIPAALNGTVPVTVTTPVGTSDPVSFRIREPHLWGVASSGGRAIAVGEVGTVMFSEDAGGDWNRVETDVSLNLYSISAADASTAWAVGEGGVILKTSDGGATWTPQNSRVRTTLYAVSAADASTAWAVGEGGVIL